METITKDDLRQLGLQLVNDIEKIIEEKIIKKDHNEDQEWLRSKSIRRILDISPGTLQNIRITGKIRFRKILGSYYYNRADLIKMFGDGSR